MVIKNTYGNGEQVLLICENEGRGVLASITIVDATYPPFFTLVPEIKKVFINHNRENCHEAIEELLSYVITKLKGPLLVSEVRYSYLFKDFGFKRENKKWVWNPFEEVDAG